MPIIRICDSLRLVFLNQLSIMNTSARCQISATLLWVRKHHAAKTMTTLNARNGQAWVSGCQQHRQPLSSSAPCASLAEVSAFPHTSLLIRSPPGATRSPSVAFWPWLAPLGPAPQQVRAGQAQAKKCSSGRRPRVRGSGPKKRRRRKSRRRLWGFGCAPASRRTQSIRRFFGPSAAPGVPSGLVG
jgi:hypothetical protein